MTRAFGYFLILAIAIGQVSLTHAAADANSGKARFAACAGCHGTDGNSPTPAFPSLAGQHDKYIARQLADFKSGKRQDPTMNAMAAGLSEQDIRDIAAFVASQKPMKPKDDAQQSGVDEESAPDPETIAKGKSLYLAGNENSQAPACAACHGRNGEGDGLAGFPSLDAQSSAYLLKALNDFKDGIRRNDEGETMRSIAAKLTKAEIESLAAYLSNLR